MKGNVTGHYVAIRPDEVETVSKGGIILDTDIDPNKRARTEAATTKGTVVSIGPNAWIGYAKDKPWAKIGDRVVYVRHVAKIIEDEDDLDADGKARKLFVMTDENIIWNLDAENENE